MSQKPNYNSNYLLDLLRCYRTSDNDANWFAATLVKKQGSSYRQPGAMMLVSPLGQRFGLISGGCLENNIREQARKVEASGQSLCTVYDTTDEQSIAAELGLGCNGRVEILTQELTTVHRSVLLQLLERLEAGKKSYLLQCFSSANQDDLQQMVILDEQRTPLLTTASTPLPDLSHLSETRHKVITERGRQWSLNRYLPPVNFWVFGGGIDARPVVQFATQMGWRVTLVDHRLEYAREKDFPGAERILRDSPEHFSGMINANAAVLMSHNLGLDTAWLERLQACTSLRYLGLLGPVDRKHEVMRLARVSCDSDFAQSIHGPMGLDIGGDTPESIALSTLAQCHQVLFSH